MPAARRFPPPCMIEEHNNACFIVRDDTGQALGYFYFEDEPGRRSAAKLLTPRRGAAMTKPAYSEGSFRTTPLRRRDPFVERMADHRSSRRLRVALVRHVPGRTQDITNAAILDRSANALLRPR